MSNPYQVPEVQEVQAVPPGIPDSIAVRQFHLSHEASVKGVGSLYLLGGVLMLVATVTAIQGSKSLEPSQILSTGGLNIPFSIAGIIAGLGLRKLRPWAKILAIVLSAISLLSLLLALGVMLIFSKWFGPMIAAAAIGGVINAYVIFLMVSSKGTMVFSPHYREIINQTPEIRYRSRVVRVLLLVIVVLIVLAGLALLVRG